MIALLFSLLLASAPMTQPSDSLSLPPDSLQTDTMREVTVRAGKHIPLPGMVLNSKGEVKAPPSLGGILEKLSPGINDKMLHPFAMKQRKKERRRKRSLKALERFDRVKTFDELLHEAYERQQREDAAPGE